MACIPAYFWKGQNMSKKYDLCLRGKTVTGHGFCEKMVLRQGVESVMKVAWRDGSQKTKFVG